jgi:hypothetical protein
VKQHLQHFQQQQQQQQQQQHHRGQQRETESGKFSIPQRIGQSRFPVQKNKRSESEKSKRRFSAKTSQNNSKM